MAFSMASTVPGAMAPQRIVQTTPTASSASSVVWQVASDSISWNQPISFDFTGPCDRMSAFGRASCSSPTSAVAACPSSSRVAAASPSSQSMQRPRRPSPPTKHGGAPFFSRQRRLSRARPTHARGGSNRVGRRQLNPGAG